MGEKWWTTAPGETGWFWTRWEHGEEPRLTKLGFGRPLWRRFFGIKGGERRYYARVGRFPRSIDHAHKNALEWWPTKIKEPVW